MVTKYFSVFKRLISCFLCLFLLFSLFSIPIEANATEYYYAAEATWALFSALKASGFFSDTAEGFSSAVSSIWDGLTAPMQEWFGKQADRLWITLPEDTALWIKGYIFNNSFARRALKHKDVDLESEDLTLEQVPIVDSSTKIYLPTEEAMLNPHAITQEQVLTGFEREQLGLLNDIKIGLRQLPHSLAYELNYSYSKMQESLINIRDNFIRFYKQFNYYMPILNDNLISIYDRVRIDLSNINTNVINIYNVFYKYFNFINDNILATFLLLRDQISVKLDNIAAQLNIFPQQITDKIDDLAAQLEIFPQQITDKLGTLGDKLDHLADVITVPEQGETVAKPQVQVQVGTQAVLVHDYATLKNAFSLKMGWVPQIFDFLSGLRSRLNSGTPPKIPIRLSAAEGSVNWGSDTYILDMSWYTRYKPYVDTILSGIMWLCFGWAMYKRIPDIISGVGLTVENATEARGHVWSGRAEREERRNSNKKGKGD